MTDKPQETAQNLSKLVEQSVSTLQEVDRRLQMVRTDLATLISKAAQLQMPGAPGPLGASGAFGPAGPLGPPFLGGLGAGLGGLGVLGADRPGLLGPGVSYPSPAAPGLHGAPLPPPGMFPLPVPGAMAPLPGMIPPQGPGAGLAGAAGVGLGALGSAGRPGEAPMGMAGLPRMPHLDLVDQGDDYILQVELPGVKKEDLDIMVSDRSITVHGQARPEVGEGQVLLSERGPVVYRRMIPLPTEVHTVQSRATFKDGILTLTVRKKVPTEGPRKVDVAYG